ncbi:hypothetical protein FPV67DRAFT_1479131, partial [Lyophyllum atratum]
SLYRNPLVLELQENGLRLTSLCHISLGLGPPDCTGIKGVSFAAFSDEYLSLVLDPHCHPFYLLRQSFSVSSGFALFPNYRCAPSCVAIYLRRHTSIMGFASFPPSVRKTTTGLRPPAYNYNCSAPHWRLHFDSFFLYHTIGPWMFPLCYGPDSIHRICFVPAFRPHDNRRRVPSCTPVYPRYSTLVPSDHFLHSTPPPAFSLLV